MQQRRALARAPRGGEEFLLRKVLLRRPLQLGNALIADSLDERCQDFGARAKPIELVGGDMKIFEIARLHIGDRKSVVSGQRVLVRVDLGGRRIIKKNNYVK